MALRLGVFAYQPSPAALALRGHQLNEVLHGLGRHQRSLMFLVSGLAPGALPRRLLPRARAAGRIRRRRARGVAGVLRQPLLQLRHPQGEGSHQRHQLRDALVPLCQLCFQHRDSGILGVNRAHLTGSTVLGLPCR